MESSPAPVSLHDLEFVQLEARLVADGLKPAHTRALWRSLYRDLTPRLEARPEFLPPLQR